MKTLRKASSRTLKIKRDLSTLPTSTEPTSPTAAVLLNGMDAVSRFRINGTVVNAANGSQLAGLRVRAYSTKATKPANGHQRSKPQEHLLGESTTDSRGGFEIAF